MDSSDGRAPKVAASGTGDPASAQLGAGSSSVDSGGEESGSPAPLSPSARRAPTILGIVMMLLALGFTVHAAQSILIPIVFAFVLQALFAPMVRLGVRRSIPRPVSAAVVTIGSVGLLAFAASYLAAPAALWMDELPRTATRVRDVLDSWHESVEDVRRATEEVEDLANMGGESDAPIAVSDSDDSLIGAMIDKASNLLMSTALTLTLLFLLLAHDGSFLRNLVEILPDLTQKKRAARVILGFQSELSVYLRTISLINAALGLAVGLALWALGMPNPILWGCMAAVLNFVPYVGTAIGIVVVALVGLITFDSPAQALLPALCYLVCSGLEGGILTPAVIGRSLVLSPAAVLIWLVLWGWLWGIAGALLAVPLLMAVKVLCEQIPELRPIATLLSSHSKSPREAH